MFNRRSLLSTSFSAVFAGLLFMAATGCPQAEDEGRTIQGKGDEPVTPGTRGIQEGAPPTGLRQNPGQPKSDRPAPVD